MNARGNRFGILLVGVLGWGHAASAMVIVPQPPAMAAWVIESADYTGEVKDQIVRLDARYTIQVIRDGWMEIPIAIQGATVTAIEIEKKSGEAHIIPRGGFYVLAVSRKGTYRVHVKCSNLLVQDSQFEGIHVGIPQATFSTMSLIVPRKDVELRPTDQLYVESQPDAQRGGVKLTARLGAADQIDLRWRTKPAAPVKVEPVVYGEVHTLVTVEEQLARLTSIIEYRAAQGETKEFLVRLPVGLNILNVRGAGIDDWRVSEEDGHKQLSVTLNFALKDTTYRLVVEGEETIEERAVDFTLPEIELVGVKQERGYLGVSRDGSLELSAQATDGINRIDVRELPELLRAAAGSPAILAFKYHQHPYHVVLGLTRHDDHPVLAAIAERGELVTVLSRQGELLTRATYLVKTNKKQFLEVILPEGATLWSCLVGGKSVKPVEGAEKKLLVPLDASSETAQAVSVELVYFEHRPELTGVGHLTLQGPILDVPTTIANWAVYTPRDVKFLRVSGNLERGAAVGDFLDEPFMQVASAAEPTGSPTFFDKVGRKLEEFEERTKESIAVHSRTVQLQDASVPYNSNGEAKPSSIAGGGREREGLEEVVESLGGLQETGILPLKIRLPKSGTVYRFNRLMTTQEAPELNATFVHVQMPWIHFAGLGLILLPLGGFVSYRVRRG